MKYNLIIVGTASQIMNKLQKSGKRKLDNCQVAVKLLICDII
jgi:hypothetical protein